MKNVALLGGTGSIGDATVKILSLYKDCFRLKAVTTNSNIKKLFSIIELLNPEYAVVTDQDFFYKEFNSYQIQYKGIQIYSGIDGLQQIYNDNSIDIVVNGISGKAGLKPSFDILSSGKDLAIANKESIVCAGKILRNKAIETGAKIIPVDSEHSAVFSLLNRSKSVEKIILTASGGPFLRLDKSNWNTITVSDALDHPTWKMGNKISIDSATMANKGLEVIEAHELFGFDYDKIKVMIHPQSLIHSMIETSDGELYAQIGPNDMSIPVQNALSFPEIIYNNYNRFDFTGSYNFELIPVDFNKFKMLEYAYLCGKKGGFFPPFYNFVNEILVNYFLNGSISFIEIESIMEKSIEMFNNNKEWTFLTPDLENLSVLDDYALNVVNKLIGDA